MRYILTLLAFVFTLLAGTSVLAGPSAGVASRINFVDSHLGSTSWTPVVTSTVKGIKGLSVFSTGALPIEVGIAYASAAADAEVRQMIVPPALTLVGAPGAIFYPMAVGYGARISVRALSSTGAAISAGEMDMSLFY